MPENNEIASRIASGRYVVDHENCAAHELCVCLAPRNFRWESCGANVFKQPETSEEQAGKWRL
jgi:ferredoxin